MKKSVIALLLLAVVENAFAGRVGAQFPQFEESETPSFYTEVVVKSANSTKADALSDKQASKEDVAVFNARVEGISAKMQKELEAKLAEKLASTLQI